MKNTTYFVKFDPKTLPAWARRHPEVVALCERNLAFRCDVCSAETSYYKKFLIGEAIRRFKRAQER